mmetsp:Transcript_7258/g.22120  ORF Transcript_7258/g.22120 Transcript_7258/m.22120 type:complete len:80 (-) Transcript_7258:825-1064(-)
MGSQTTRAPSNCTVHDSNSDKHWQVADTENGRTASRSEQQHIFSNPDTSSQFRLVIAGNNDSRTGAPVLALSVSRPEFY